MSFSPEIKKHRGYILHKEYFNNAPLQMHGKIQVDDLEFSVDKKVLHKFKTGIEVEIDYTTHSYPFFGVTSNKVFSIEPTGNINYHNLEYYKKEEPLEQEEIVFLKKESEGYVYFIGAFLISSIVCGFFSLMAILFMQKVFSFKFPNYTIISVVLIIILFSSYKLYNFSRKSYKNSLRVGIKWIIFIRIEAFVFFEENNDFNIRGYCNDEEVKIQLPLQYKSEIKKFSHLIVHMTPFNDLLALYSPDNNLIFARTGHLTNGY